MAFSRPTLLELVNRIRNDILARFRQSDQLRRTDGEVYARVHSGAVHGLYGHQDYISLQILPYTADEDNLKRMASAKGMTQKLAAQAVGTATFTTEIGALIPANTVLKALDGQEYTTTVGATSSGVNITLPVKASVAGAAGNRTAGQSLSLVSPVPGVQGTALASELSAGADIEDIEEFRARYIERLRQPPHGGSKADYIAWAKEVAGVTRAWCFPLEMGAGTVTVRCVRDNDSTPFPDSTELLEVKTHIEDVRPVTATLYVVAPIEQLVNLSIALNPNTPDTRAAVLVELQDFFLREGAPGTTLFRSRISEAISAGNGEYSHNLSVPNTDIVVDNSHLARLGAVTWL